MTGSVTFYMDTLDEAGLADLATTSTATLTSTLVSGLEGGFATASVVVPPGLLGQARVAAFYGGDARYLASWSAASSVTATSTFAVTPETVTVPLLGSTTFTASGGVSPVMWTVVTDSTCDKSNHCATIAAVSPTVGKYQPGPVDGLTVIAAIDADGAEARATITVAGTALDGGSDAPVDAATPDASPARDAAKDGPVDVDAVDGSRGAGTEPSGPDGAARDATMAEDGQGSAAGCGCRNARGGDAPGRGTVACLLAAAALARRRRRS